MAGSWEICASNRVLVGILHTEVTTVAWSFGLRNLIVPGREELRQWSPFLPVAGMPYDHARNSIVKTAIHLGAEYVFMLDSDVIPPHDVIPRLMAHQREMVSGVYFRRSPPAGRPVAQKGGTWVDLSQHPPNQLIEVDVVGAGCLLMEVEFLKRLPPQRPDAGKTHFDWRVDMAGLLPPYKCMSEDFTLCVHAKEMMGVSTWLDPTIRCRHAGSSEAYDGGLKPLETVPIT